MSDSRFMPLGPLDSGPSSRAFLGYEEGASGPLWPVVLVWVPEDVEEDPDRMSQLREDTERAAQIDHPNVIRVIGCERLDEGFARVVEFGDAESLRGFLSAARAAQRPLPPPFLLRVLSDAAAGVHHVHEMGQAEGNVRSRLHGALRPETLLVGFDGTTKVTGYGALAVAPRDVFGARLSPRLQYLSPEELEGGPGAADRRSDVYGLGLVLYDALAGRLPYRIAEPDFEQRVLAGELPIEPLAAVPPLLRELVAKALARKPADRFPTAALFQQAVEGLSPWTAAQVSQVCAALIPESSPERSGRAQLLREVGFPPGPLPRPVVRHRAPAAKPAAPKPVQPTTAARPQSAPPPPAISRPLVVERTLTPPPPRQGIPLAAVVIGGLVFALLLVGLIFVARPDLGRALVSGTPVLPPLPQVQPLAQVKAALPPDVPPEPLPLPPPAPLPATLDLSSDPPMQVAVDGKAQGTTPVSLEVSAGDHHIRFHDATNGIDVERTVHAKEGGHLKVPVHLSRASMEISAPDGATVFLDGKAQGTAPLAGPIKFFEGHHDIKVKMGKAVFDRQFTAQAGEALTLDVHPTAE